MYRRRSSTHMVFAGFLFAVLLLASVRATFLLQERSELLSNTAADLQQRSHLLAQLDSERLELYRNWLSRAANTWDPGAPAATALAASTLQALPAPLHFDGVVRPTAGDRRWPLTPATASEDLLIDDGSAPDADGPRLRMQHHLATEGSLQVSLPLAAFAADRLPDARFQSWLLDPDGAVVHHPAGMPQPPSADSSMWLQSSQVVEPFGLTRVSAISRAEVLGNWHRSIWTYLLAVVTSLSLLATGYGIFRRSEASERAAQQAYQERLLELANASREISRGRGLKGIFERCARLARELIPAHQAVASASHRNPERHDIHAVSLSEDYGAWQGYDEAPTGAGIYRLVMEQQRSLRLTQAELEAHPDFRGFGDAAERHPPLHGLLAAPVVTSSGRGLGLLQLSHRMTGEFNAEDEAILQQLASVAAAAIEQAEALSALQESRAAAERSRDEYARLLESLGEVYLGIDQSGSILELNPAAAALYDIDAEAMRGRPLADLDPEIAESPVREQFERVVEDRELRRFTWHHQQLNRIFEVHAFPTPTGIGALLSDVTEQRHTEEQLRQAQKMEIVGQLTGGVAHDFNNLLTVILGQVDLLAQAEEYPPTAEDWRSGLALIAEASQRAAQLTQRLLAFARKQTLNPTLVNPGAALKQIEPLLRRTIGANVEIEVVQSAGLWDVEIDVNQFENAILNLALNARDAMPDGGRLSIEATNMRVDEHYAEANAGIEPGQYVMVAVTDTGHGMEPEVASRAFEPFFTTKEVGAGTGLGLSMVYGFLRQSGGQAKIYSEPGEGTMVRLYLPRRFNAEESARERQEPIIASLPSGHERILLVEDDDLVRAFVSRSLDQLGYRVTPVADGPAAIALLDRGERFDLLFTDVVLPGGMSGRQVAEAVSERQPGIRVLYASGYSDNAIVHQGRLDHDVAFLSKPFTQLQLATQLRRVLEDQLP